MMRERNATGAAKNMYKHIQHMENRVQSYYKNKQDRKDPPTPRTQSENINTDSFASGFVDEGGSEVFE